MEEFCLYQKSSNKTFLDQEKLGIRKPKVLFFCYFSWIFNLWTWKKHGEDFLCEFGVFIFFNSILILLVHKWLQTGLNTLIRQLISLFIGTELCFIYVSICNTISKLFPWWQTENYPKDKWRRKWQFVGNQEAKYHKKVHILYLWSRLFGLCSKRILTGNLWLRFFNLYRRQSNMQNL